MTCCCVATCKMHEFAAQDRGWLPSTLTGNPAIGSDSATKGPKDRSIGPKAGCHPFLLWQLHPQMPCLLSLLLKLGFERCIFLDQVIIDLLGHSVVLRRSISRARKNNAKGKVGTSGRSLVWHQTWLWPWRQQGACPLSPLRDAPQSYVLAAFFHSFVGTVYGSEILHQLNMVNIPSFTRFHTCWVVSRVSEPSTVISGENLIYLQENPKKVGHAKKKKHLGCQLSHTQGSWS